jgi:hypothetical protein
MMTPTQAFANRTARLVKEATTPVYSTETKPVVREHIIAVELDGMMGRHWSEMAESKVDEFITTMTGDDEFSDGLSDIDHSAKCWCQK